MVPRILVIDDSGTCQIMGHEDGKLLREPERQPRKETL
jgi:hypothetical protein